MKKTLLIFLALLLLLPTLAACGGRKTADVHVFYYTYSDPYISTVRSALDGFLRAENLSFQDYDGNNSQTTQTEQVQTAITKGAKLLVVNVVTTGSDDAAASIVALAKKADIPVLFFNREVSDEIVKSYEKCVFIGTDAAEAGRLQGDMIGEYLVNNYEKVDLNGDGEISYVLFMGEKGNREAALRTEYSVKNANEKLAAAGKKPLRFYDKANTDGYLLDREGKWSAQAANDYMTTILASYSTANKNMVELVICNNDGMAEGAISALSAAGYNSGGNAATIPVFGVDATSAARELIAAGKMAGTIKQDSEGMARALLHVAENALAGGNLLSGMDDYHVDSDVAKVRVSYSIYTGEK